MNQLQRSLRLNALFSAFSGIILLVLHNQIANLFDTANYSVFIIIGFLLIFFSATIIFEIRRQNPLGVLIIIFQDFLWVVGSAIILLFQPFELSKIGNELIAAVALIVLFMGVNQSKALAQVDSGVKKGIKYFHFERVVKASKLEAWKVISDVGNYHNVAPNIDDVRIISGNGKGMIRSCSHKNDSWTETCTKWNEGDDYVFEVNTKAEDYPYPFQYLQGHWKVEKINENETKIIMNFEFQYNQKFQNWLLHPLLKSKFTKTAEALLDNWQTILEN